MTDNTINDDLTMGGAAFAGGAKRFRAGDEILGRYVVEAELGQGGMGVVYLCLDKIGGVKVAVKGLPPEVSHNSDEMEAVRDNYRLVHELHHPNIAGVNTLERDVKTGDYYLVMDFARGVTLKHWMRRHGGRGHRAEQLNVLRQIASALDYAHSAAARHIIHRDIKPENVMVDEHGCVSVLDFGLAAQVRSSLSRVSQVVTSRSGTPVYKSPEQWLAQAQHAPSDQYSLGVIAYQMFAGELPYDSDDLEILKHAVVFDPVPEIQGEGKTVNAVFAKVLAKKPQARFASCGAFVAALEQKRSPRPKPYWAVIGLCMAVAVPLGVVVHESLKDAELADVTEQQSIPAPEPAPAPAPEPAPDPEPKPMPAPKPAATVEIVDDTPTNVVVETALTVDELMEIDIGTLKAGAERTVRIGEDFRIDLVWCPSGSFVASAPESGVRVIRDGFWLGKYEVTQAQWKRVMAHNPSRFTASDLGKSPVDSVTFPDCERFVEALNRLAGVRGFRLLSAVEWEYACRAGSAEGKAATETVNCVESRNGRPKACGSSGANAWGICDMRGNVGEWTSDVMPRKGFRRSGNVICGGCWKFSSRDCLASSKKRENSNKVSSCYGMRVCFQPDK